MIANRLGRIHLAIECPSNIRNAMAAIRSAEAFGLTDIHLITPEGEAEGAKTITQGALYWVRIHYYESLTTFLEQMTTQDPHWQLAGGCLNTDRCLSDVPHPNTTLSPRLEAKIVTSTPISDPRPHPNTLNQTSDQLPYSNTLDQTLETPISAQTPNNQNRAASPGYSTVCLMIGNEERGLSDAALQACQWPYKIPMYGMSQSLNLSVSAAISVYDITRRYRAALSPRTGDLTAAEQRALTARYYLNSLETRLLDGLF